MLKKENGIGIRSRSFEVGDGAIRFFMDVPCDATHATAVIEMMSKLDIWYGDTDQYVQEYALEEMVWDTVVCRPSAVVDFVCDLLTFLDAFASCADIICSPLATYSADTRLMTLRLTVNFEPFLLSALMSDLNEVITQSEIRVRPVYSTTSFSFHILSRMSD